MHFYCVITSDKKHDSVEVVSRTGRTNLDSLCLMDYSFINTALENELRSYKDPVTPLSEDTHMVSCDRYECCSIFDPHLSRSSIFFSLHNLSISASFRAAINLSTSAFDFPDSSLLRATSCSRSLRRSVMSGHFLVASSVFWVCRGGGRHTEGVDRLGTKIQ